jgi:hypothetical protein
VRWRYEVTRGRNVPIRDRARTWSTYPRHPLHQHLLACLKLHQVMIRGIVVMYEEDEELVVVNVIGKIRPETLSNVMEGLDIEIPLLVIEDLDPDTADR